MNVKNKQKSIPEVMIMCFNLQKQYLNYFENSPRKRLNPGLHRQCNQANRVRSRVTTYRNPRKRSAAQSNEQSKADSILLTFTAFTLLPSHSTCVNVFNSKQQEEFICKKIPTFNISTITTTTTIIYHQLMHKC